MTDPVLEQYFSHKWPGQWRAEVKFHPIRGWRFDYAHRERMVGVEIEGVVDPKKGKSRHTEIGGYRKDTIKYNYAQLLGWVVLRFLQNEVDYAMIDEVMA